LWPSCCYNITEALPDDIAHHFDAYDYGAVVNGLEIAPRYYKADDINRGWWEVRWPKDLVSTVVIFNKMAVGADGKELYGGMSLVEFIISALGDARVRELAKPPPFHR
jgi:hypothetical protein